MLRPSVLVWATCSWMSEHGALEELYWRRKSHNTWRKCQFVHHKSHTGSIAGFRGDRPATNRLSQGTVVYALESTWASDRHVSTRQKTLTHIIYWASNKGKYSPRHLLKKGLRGPQKPSRRCGDRSLVSAGNRTKIRTSPSKTILCVYHQDSGATRVFRRQDSAAARHVQQSIFPPHTSWGRSHSRRTLPFA